MPRAVVIALGVLLWTAFAVVAAFHVAADDPLGPILAVVIVATSVTVWHLRRRPVPSP